MGALYTLYIQTEGHIQMLDITGDVQRLVSECGISSGICVLFLPHTTAGLMISEKRDPYLAVDFTKAVHVLTGEEQQYRNLEGNFAAHLSSALTGVSLTVPVEDGRLALGAWQSIYLMEFDGSRKRKIRVKFMEDV